MKQNKYWQVVRGICMILVILIHTLYFSNNTGNDYTNIVIRRVINFSTALFIFMAGYFTRIDDAKSFYKKKIFRLVIPLIIWDVIYTLISVISEGMPFNKIIEKLILSNSVGHLYFIYVLVVLFLIAPLLIKYIKKTDNKKIQLLPLVITPIYNIFLTIYHVKFNDTFILYNYWIFGWITYYYLGLLCSNRKDILKKNFILESFTIITLICSILEGVLLYTTFNVYSLAISQLTFSNSLYCIFICLLLVKREKQTSKENLLSKIGDYSFGMYLSHILFIYVIKKITSLCNLNYFANVLIIFVCTLIATYIANKVYYEYIKKVLYGKCFRKK